MRNEKVMKNDKNNAHKVKVNHKAKNKIQNKNEVHKVRNKIKLVKSKNIRDKTKKEKKASVVECERQALFFIYVLGVDQTDVYPRPVHG